MANLTIHNIDPALKAEVQKIMKLHGLTARATVQAFFRKLVSDHQQGSDACFCHELEVNEKTRRVLEKTDKGQDLVPCKDADELFAKLGLTDA